MRKYFFLLLCGVYLALNAQAQFPWTQKAFMGTVGDERMLASGFSIGTKGYVCTGWNNPNYKKDLWEWDQTTNIWTQKANFGGTARYGAVGFSIGNKGYVGTGYDGAALKDFWEYDPATNLWTQKADFGGSARVYSAGFSVGNKGYITTGGWSVLDKECWAYDPTANNWTQKANFGGTGRSYAAAFSIGTKGYVGTGADASGATDDLWEYNSLTDTWKYVTNVPGYKKQGAVGFAVGNKGYIATGWNINFGYRKEIYEFDPVMGWFTQLTQLQGPARENATAFSIGSKGYITCGTSGGLNRDLWEFDPTCGLTVVATSIPPPCNDSSGSISLNVSGGISPYTYHWWSPNGKTTPMITGLKPGSYAVDITNANCLATFSAHFTDSCDHVWPGDANNDSIANNMDILAIGMGYGKTGPARTNASLNWTGQLCDNWIDTLPNDTNCKHIDCNGDGMINYQDTNAVILNYGKTHPNDLATPPHLLTDPDLYANIAIDTIGSGGGMVTVNFGLGTLVLPATNVYGVAFTVNFSDPGLVNPYSVSFKGQSSWMGTLGTDLISVGFNNNVPASVDAAITRIDHLDRTGYGIIGTLKFSTTNSLFGTGLTSPLVVSITDPIVIAKNGTVVPVNTTSDTVFVKDSSNATYIITKDYVDHILISPNPTNRFTTVSFPSSTTEVAVTDLVGQEIFHSRDLTTNKCDINLSSFPSGIYFLQVRTENGLVTKKIIKD